MFKFLAKVIEKLRFSDIIMDKLILIFNRGEIRPINLLFYPFQEIGDFKNVRSKDLLPERLQSFRFGR